MWEIFSLIEYQLIPPKSPERQVLGSYTVYRRGHCCLNRSPAWRRTVPLSVRGGGESVSSRSEAHCLLPLVLLNWWPFWPYSPWIPASGLHETQHTAELAINLLLKKSLPDLPCRGNIHPHSPHPPLNATFSNSNLCITSLSRGADGLWWTCPHLWTHSLECVHLLHPDTESGTT